MLNSGFAFAIVMVLGTLLFATSNQAKAARLQGQAAPQILGVATMSLPPSSSGGGSQPGGATTSATASASTASGSAAGEGTCSAEASSEAEVRIGNKVVRRSVHKRAAQSANGCNARAESSAEANSGTGGSGTTPQR